MRKIALEEHFATPGHAKKYVARPTQSDALFADIERRLVDLDQLRLETMDKAGKDLSVLSVTTPSVQAEPDTKAAIRLAREANDFLARRNGRIGMQALPIWAMQDAKATANEPQRKVKDLRFKGALTVGPGGHYLDEDQYLPLALPETQGHSRPHGRDAARFFCGASIAGGNSTLPRRSRRGSLPSDIIKRYIFITTSGVCAAPPLDEAIGALGEDSVKFSVDYPCDDAQIASTFIESAPLSEDVRAKVCHGNTELLLGL